VNLIKKAITTGLIGAYVALFNIAAAEDEAAKAAENNAEDTLPQAPVAQTVKESQVGDTLYVSESANVWLRQCPRQTCPIIYTAHVGDTVSFLKISDDGKYVLVKFNGHDAWMQYKDLQIKPCGKAMIDILEGKIAELKNSLENYDSEIATNYRNAKAKVEKLEKENAMLKETLASKNEKIEELDATRRDFADKLETKELDMQLRWWLQGAIIAFCGALIGIICVYIPRPGGNRRKERF